MADGVRQGVLSLADLGVCCACDEPVTNLRQCSAQSGAKWWFGTFFIFHNVWDVILPIDERIFFRGVGQPPTSHEYLGS